MEESQQAAASISGTLSADRIIAILQQNPDILATVRSTYGVRSAGSGSALSDEDIYNQIRQSSDLRARITQELMKRGYLAGSDLDQAQRPAAASGRRPTNSSSRGDEVEEPQPQSRPNPYPNVPSLQELYSQFPSSGAALKRFGSDIFRNGTGNADELPMDLPVGPDYVLGPGDSLVLNLWGSISQRLDRTVDRQGQIALPEAGTISVAGQTISQAQQSIQKALSSQFQAIKVEISLARLRTVRVYVVGDVQRPGAYDISSLSTALNALYAAGGPTSRGSLRTVRHYRGKELVQEVDLYEFLLRGVRSNVARLQAGDTILVPPIGPQVAVSGMVRRPALYELKGEQGLNEVLDLAGGVLVSATMRQISVDRIEAHERHTMLSLQLHGDGKSNADAKALVAFRLQDGDRITISPILPYNEQAVYLEGHVYRPGKYPYRDGITVSELLRSYQDLLPEPADRAEIVRLQPPDWRPVTISFNLSEVLTGGDPIPLQPFDVIRVYSRYEIDPPKVAIYGEVLRPGEYPLAKGMTAAGLVRMAGGFKRSAFRDQADITSYVIENGRKVLIKTSTVEIAKALDGDTKADVALKTGDVVSIRQLSGWTDIGSSVIVRGEVRYPGTYGIREGERLSSVLKRAGGFRETAYPPGAVLLRVQVREMQEKNRLELISKVESAGRNLKPGTMSGQEQLALVQAMQQQEQQVLAALRSHPATGRLVINISTDIAKWENTPADVEMRAGDELVVPKRPAFVVVSGQAYNPSAISYAPGRTLEWYLKQAGGPTELANKKAIFIIRADGSVVGEGSGGWWGSSISSTRMLPGDSIVVPEKVISGTSVWKNVIGAAQLMSAVAITAAAVSSF